MDLSLTKELFCCVENVILQPIVTFFINFNVDNLYKQVSIVHV